MEIQQPPAHSVIFDLDGTLVDSEPAYYEAGRRLLARYGVRDFSWENHTRFLGIGTRETLTVLREEYGIEAPVDELLAGKNALYLELAEHSVTAFPEMRALVERLHGNGVAMAVASGSSRAAIEIVLGVTGLREYLPVLVSADEVAHGKPAPDVFLEAAGRLGAAPDSCVVLEDAVPGVRAALAAGMRCVAVPGTEVPPDPAAFGAVDLLFPGGQDEFTAEAVLSWLAGG
ncbi:HAD family hydrolase [Streptomyces sp. NPDC059166]|uniref:HAD family hydrolase n=1 Tax=Streptomyces sp. NPDC059166 TaxID=3346752 RepID=UPI00367ACA5E